jgi:surface carbohydrate biosynthesis protein
LTEPTPTAAPLLVFPMEIVDRELNGNMLLASEAIKRGWQCIIGTKRPIYESLRDLPPSLFFLKSITLSDAPQIREILAAGHKVVTLDVEGLVYADLYEFVTARFHADTMDMVETIMFWGDTQRRAVVEAYPDFAKKCVTTGSPIVDFWRPECGLQPFFDQEVKALKERFGSFILIPSSFGLPNHKMGKQASTKIIERDQMIDEKSRKAFFEHWMAYEEHVEKVFHRFLKMLPEISKAFSDKTIIIRPHPAEAHETWIKAAEGLDNVKVVYEGVVSSWLLASEAVLHWGCTTGIEAFLMGRPVVAYNPISADEEKYDHKLPHSVSIETRSVEECVAALKDVLARPHDLFSRYPGLKAGADAFRDWAYEPASGLACIAVMEELEKFRRPSVTVRPANIHDKPSVRMMIWSAIEAVDRVAGGKIPFPARIRHGLETLAYGRQKAKDIPETLAQSVWGRLVRMRGLKGAAIRTLKKNMFLVTPG